MAATTPKRQKPEAKEAVGARLLEMREGNTLLQNPMQRRMQAAPRSSSAAELRADIAALKAELLAKVKGTAAIADTGSIARPGNLLEAPAPIAKAGGIAKAGKLLEAAVPTAKAGGIAEACKLLDAAAPIAEAACVAVAPAGSVQDDEAVISDARERRRARRRERRLLAAEAAATENAGAANLGEAGGIAEAAAEAVKKDVVANRPYKRRADEREDGGKQADALEVVKRADANKLGEASGVAKTAAGAAKEDKAAIDWLTQLLKSNEPREIKRADQRVDERGSKRAKAATIESRDAHKLGDAGGVAKAAAGPAKEGEGANKWPFDNLSKNPNLRDPRRRGRGGRKAKAKAAAAAAAIENADAIKSGDSLAQQRSYTPPLGSKPPTQRTGNTVAQQLRHAPPLGSRSRVDPWPKPVPVRTNPARLSPPRMVLKRRQQLHSRRCD